MPTCGFMKALRITPKIFFVEYHFGKKDAEDYVIGSRRGIRNDRPIIGVYGTNREGSGDMYPKGGNMLHTIRHIINDDAKWLSIMRGLNADFWHQTVTTEQIESYISTKAGIDLSKIFDQYLRTTNIPLLKYKVSGKTVAFNYERVVKGFAMPIRVAINGKEVVIKPSEVKQTFEFSVFPFTLYFNNGMFVVRRYWSNTLLRSMPAFVEMYDSICSVVTV